MKFQHNHLTYDTDQLGKEAIENIARQAAYARNVGQETLELLGFAPDHEFKPRVSQSPHLSPAYPPRQKKIEHHSFRLEH